MLSPSECRGCDRGDEASRGDSRVGAQVASSDCTSPELEVPPPARRRRPDRATIPDLALALAPSLSLLLSSSTPSETQSTPLYLVADRTARCDWPSNPSPPHLLQVPDRPLVPPPSTLRPCPSLQATTQRSFASRAARTSSSTSRTRRATTHLPSSVRALSPPPPLCEPFYPYLR